jgi:hypothetical protein
MARTTNQVAITGPKKVATRAVHHEQQRQDHNGERHHEVLERGCCQIETFNGRQHRDCRSDHGVAEEHRGANQPEQENKRGSSPQRPGRERSQRECTTLPVVVRAQQQHDIFERDDNDQRPQDQRQHAEDGITRERPGCVDRLAKGVQRAGTDVAIDDPYTAERERPGTRRLVGFATGRGIGHSHMARGQRGTSVRCVIHERQGLTFTVRRQRAAAYITNLAIQHGPARAVPPFLRPQGALPGPHGTGPKNNDIKAWPKAVSGVPRSLT